MKRTLALMTAVGIALLGWLAWRQTRPVALIVSGFIEADEIRVGSRVGGRVIEVLVKEGDVLKRGQPIFRLDPFDLQHNLAESQAELAADRAELSRLKAGYRREEIAQARARREQAAATLAKLAAGPRPLEIDIARERLKAAEANLQLAREEHSRIMHIQKESRAAAQIEIERVVRALKAAEAEKSEAEHQLGLMQEGTRKEEIAEARAALAQAEQAARLMESGYRREDVMQAEAKVAASEARMRAIQTRVDELTVASPGACVVEAIDLQPGDLVTPNAPSVSLIDRSHLWVRAYVPEARLGEVHVGKKVPIAIDGFPDRRFAGHVEFIATQAEFTPRNVQTPEERGRQVFRIKVDIEEGRENLAVGVAADVMFNEAQAP